MKERTIEFAVGAAGYSGIEIAVRGHTHWTMTILGGLCLILLCWIARSQAGRPLLVQAALGAAGITAAEFCVGVVVNLALGWNVWDYYKEAGNLLGQICPKFSFYWFLLCIGVFGVLRGAGPLLKSARDLLEKRRVPRL